ncbi:hypothetical protein A210_01180 [Pseudomonas putida SJTE-1]|uniref:Uncharacterized protein n=2 Tax=Pseudomonas TaxID=286 RepID=A0A7L9GIE7_9PSED|nr:MULTISPECIES: hypothetical protein [Pseudomonas]AFK69770.1 hypothetical protein YSA_05545 [Pseudomonas putida ND6]ANI01282.1 hypothetical protein A210_01180 [Pseudomonas putida SJTE-1]QOJ92276.1 hypothetical protein ICN73_05190 [Pseudomonas taiwanensis]WQQ37302.1 hypothetical protein SO572_01235 [Pseudomonas putida]
MLINDEGFELGMPSHEEMIAHEVLLLRHENELACQQLTKAHEDIHKLVDVNSALNQQVTALRQERACMELNLNRQGGISPWGSQSSSANRAEPSLYPLL